MIRNNNQRRNFRSTLPDKIVSRTNTSEEEVPLMQFVSEKFPDSKRNDIKKWLKYSHLRVNGNVVTAFDYPVLPGDTVELNFARPFVVLKHPRLKIVYEDDDIIVVNKGYGLLSVDNDSKRTKETAYSILRNYVKEVNPLNKIFIIHRLDRDTSGLMMFAKTMQAKEAMQHNWNNMVLARTYVAVLDGMVKEDSGVISSYIGETSEHEVFSSQDPSDGKKAVTRFKVLRRAHGKTLVEFSLDTGRKNQIRIHAASELGCPISGDRRYGGTHSSLNRLALHARSLRFAHPATRKDMNFETPIPAGFLKL